MNNKERQILIKQTEVALARLRVLSLRAQLGDDKARRVLDPVLAKLLAGADSRHRGKSHRDVIAIELCGIYEDSLPFVQALKRRILFRGLAAGKDIGEMRPDLKATGADRLEQSFGPWTTPRFNRLWKRKPSEWLYEELGGVADMSRDQVHRAVQRGRKLRKAKQTRRRRSS